MRVRVNPPFPPRPLVRGFLPFVLFLLLVALASSPVTAGPAALAGDALRIVDHIGGVTETAVADGDRLYVAVGARIKMVDVSDPAAPLVLGRSEVLNGRITEIVDLGDHLLVAAWRGLQVLRKQGAAAPTPLSWLAFEGGARRVAVAGTIAFAMSPVRGGLSVVDLSEPADPRLLSFLPLEGELGAVAVAGDGRHVYVVGNDAPARGSRVIWVVDVANLNAPKVLRRVPDLTWVRDLHRVGDILWAHARIDEAHAVVALDLTDPARPTLEGQAPLDNNSIGRLAVEGDRLYATSSRYAMGEGIGLQIFDVADPAALELIGTAASDNWLSVPVPLPNGHVALTHDRGLTVYDAANPAAPEPLATVGSHGWFKNVAVTGQRVYLSSDHALQVLGPGEEGLEVRGTLYDLAPRLYLLNNPGVGLSADGGYAVVANVDTEQLQIIDCRDPANLRLVGLVTGFPLTVPNRAILRNRFAFVAPGLDPLLVLDLTDPEAPYFVARIPGSDDFMQTGWTLDVRGNRAFALGSVTVDQHVTARVGAIDITRPDAPQALGFIESWSEQARMGELAALDDAALVVWSDALRQTNGLRVADFGDPAAPRWLDQTLEIPGLSAVRVHPDGRLAVAHSWQSGLYVLDVSNPADLHVVARMPQMTDVAGITFDDTNRIYAVSYWSGLHVLEYDASRVPTRVPTPLTPTSTFTPTSTPTPMFTSTPTATSTPRPTAQPTREATPTALATATDPPDPTSSPVPISASPTPFATAPTQVWLYLPWTWRPRE